MDTKEILKKVRRIQIRTAHVVNDALAGQYHSAFRGRGMEFEEVRPYQIGDDVRTIDWNVSARTGEPFVKLFREERELTVMLVADLSASQQFGTNQQRKRELLAEVGATLAFSAIKNNDKIGFVGFTDRIEQFVPPRKGSGHVLRVIRELLAFEPVGRGTNIKAALEHVNRILRRRAVVFLLSDLQDTDYERTLRMTRQRHDLIVVHLRDRREEQFPAAGLIELVDNETGRTIVVDSASKAWRQQFERLMTQHEQQLVKRLQRDRIDMISAYTGEPFVEQLIRLFRGRELRR